jgi:polysaccharide pyruvyl transferase
MHNLDKKVAWASLTLNTPNYGNYIIEYAVKQLLGNMQPFITFELLSTAQLPREVEDSDIVFCPGATCLSITENPGLLRVNKPIVPFAACLWKKTHMKKRTIFLKNTISLVSSFSLWSNKFREDLNLGIVNKSVQPVGCRDSWTYNFLLEKGYQVEYVGCPVLFLNDQKDIEDNGYVAVSLPRRNSSRFLKTVMKNFPKTDVKVLLHEPREGVVSSKYPQLQFLQPKADARYFLDFYKHASCVVTGRLHGCLPAIVYNKPIVYVSDVMDTRNSLLTDIGVKIHKTNAWDISDLQVIKRSQYEFLETNMTQYIRQVRAILHLE